MVGCFGLKDDHHHDRVPSDRWVETHLMCDVHQMARNGLLVLGTEARIEGLGGHEPYHLTVREAGILELDGQPIQLGWHRSLPMRVAICGTCGRDCYRLHQVAAGVPHEGHIYKGANHGFHNDTTPRYDEAAAREAWQRTLDWFDKYLKV
jgi:hypothetical protein